MPSGWQAARLGRHAHNARAHSSAIGWDTRGMTMGIISTADPWTRTVGITGMPTHRSESPQKRWNPWGMEVPFGNPQMNAMNGFGRVQGYGSGSKWFTAVDHGGHNMGMVRAWSYPGSCYSVKMCVKAAPLHFRTPNQGTAQHPARVFLFIYGRPQVPWVGIGVQKKKKAQSDQY